MSVLIKQKPFLKILTTENRTQVWLADKLKMNPTHLNNVIAGRQTVSPDVRSNIMEVLEIKDWDSIFEMTD